MKLKPSFSARNLLDLPIVIGIIWLCTRLFPEDIQVADIGSLIMVSAVYYILVTLVLFVVFIIGSFILNITVGVIAAAVVLPFAGIPVLLLMNLIVNGFWIGDFATMLLVSMVTSLLVVGFQACMAAIFKR